MNRRRGRAPSSTRLPKWEAPARVDEVDGAGRALEPHDRVQPHRLADLGVRDAPAVVEDPVDVVAQAIRVRRVDRAQRAGGGQHVVEVDEHLHLRRVGVVEVPELRAARCLLAVERVPDVDLPEHRHEAEIRADRTDDVVSERDRKYGEPRSRSASGMKPFAMKPFLAISASASWPSESISALPAATSSSAFPTVPGGKTA